MSVASQVLTVVFLIAFLFGLRSTIRLWQRTLGRPGSPGLLISAFAIVATIVTVVAGVFGILGIRRMVGFSPLDWTPLLTVIAATAIVVIPEFLDWVVTRIERGDT